MDIRRGLKKYLLKDDTEFIITFPKGINRFIFQYECCDCGAMHDVSVHVDFRTRKVTLMWTKKKCGKMKGSNGITINEMSRRQKQS